MGIQKATIFDPFELLFEWIEAAPRPAGFRRGWIGRTNKGELRQYAALAGRYYGPLPEWVGLWKQSWPEKFVYISITGGRDYERLSEVSLAIEYFKRRCDRTGIVPVIIAGAAPGVDRLAEKTAKRLELPVISIPADWGQFGKAAGPIRNGPIVFIGDFTVAFPAANSRGTYDAIRQAQSYGKQVYIVPDGTIDCETAELYKIKELPQPIKYHRTVSDAEINGLFFEENPYDYR